MDAETTTEEVMPYRSRPEDDLKALAKQVFRGEIFIATKPEEVRLAFPMILMTISREQMEQYARDDVVAWYAPYSWAAPRTTNGVPFFVDAAFLDRADYHKMFEYVARLREAEATALEG
jgi:hypothetical protein